MNIAHELRTTAGEQPATAHLAASERHALLANARRRHLLDVLADVDAPIDAGELALLLRERGADDLEAASVVISLHHVHLPKLAAAGVLDYDSATRTVTPATVTEN